MHCKLLPLPYFGEKVQLQNKTKLQYPPSNRWILFLWLQNNLAQSNKFPFRQNYCQCHKEKNFNISLIAERQHQ